MQLQTACQLLNLFRGSYLDLTFLFFLSTVIVLAAYTHELLLLQKTSPCDNLGP